VQPVIAADSFDRYSTLALPADARLAPPVAGGAERQDSVVAGFSALPPEFDLVVIHDAARCGVRAADIARVVAAGEESGAALLATPAGDTVKLVASGVVVRTPERGGCWLAQTPQVFHRSLYAEALAKAEADGFRGTDDAELVERLGARVRVVRGNPSNFKITVPEDLVRAERWIGGGEDAP
jgi:2-C-methyl-D-erythritol 4-phosphate cytidylyltransferase